MINKHGQHECSKGARCLLYLAAATMLAGVTQEAKAANFNCNPGDYVVVGQIPAVYFSSSSANTKRVTVTYQRVWQQNFPRDGCGAIYAESLTSKVGVFSNDPFRSGSPYYPGQVAWIGDPPQTIALHPTTVQLAIKAVVGDTPPGTGAVRILLNRACLTCPLDLVPIAMVSVFVSGEEGVTTPSLFAATAPTVLNVDPMNTNPLSGAVANQKPTSFSFDSVGFYWRETARLLITPNANPGRIPLVYNYHPTGVAFTPNFQNLLGKWSIYNEDSGEMKGLSSFNVRVAGGAGLNHLADIDNTSGNLTNISSPIGNGNPNALVFVTHNYSGETTPHKQNHNLGVWYNGTKWAIFNEDRTPMQAGSDFNVEVFGFPGPGVAVHTSYNIDLPGWPKNTEYNYTWIENSNLNPLIDNNPNAIILVTPMFNLPGHSGVYVNAPIGVFYSYIKGRWAIFTEDGSPMPVGASFNVLVPTPTVY